MSFQIETKAKSDEKTKTVMVRLEVSTYEAIKTAATANGLTPAGLVKQMVLHCLKEIQ